MACNETLGPHLENIRVDRKGRNEVSRYYVTGGVQRKNADRYDEWFAYGEASIVVFDDEEGSVEPVVGYCSPPEMCPDDENASMVFKAGSIDGDRLVVCTQTEILSYSLPGFELLNHTSHRWLNDVHHVTVNHWGNYLVADTGLDMVLELTPEGEVIRELSALPEEDPWTRFDRAVDYRKVPTTKPHRSHPNYVFEVDGELWVTRFVQKDALCLSNPEKRIDAGTERLHDGFVHDGKVFFTSVDGKVVVADPGTGRVLKVHDLNAMTEANKTLGWCRGLHVLDAERVLVGFSRIRRSKFRENLQWMKYRLGQREDAGKLPTRVACYDLAKGRLEWDLDLEKVHLSAVFSILPG